MDAPADGDPEQFVGARMPKSLVDRIDARGVKEGRDRSSMIRWALQRYLDQAEAPHPKKGRGRR